MRGIELLMVIGDMCEGQRNCEICPMRDLVNEPTRRGCGLDFLYDETVARKVALILDARTPLRFTPYNLRLLHKIGTICNESKCDDCKLRFVDGKYCAITYMELSEVRKQLLQIIKQDL